ncbi:divalent-cation tolerance protein CutA [Comamonas sp. JUb58]|uniref:divalent-cation tolerance protein CutA n=1 Tax=Comamonas sp. JUb58 TaxID=2485114 RepID=UPI0010DD1C66|nr:divalent-cation tolerance protein CutA [Comamonas sp. JUb58]TDS83966.1 periplasmic divalent cation tolerance protein [Comamonas sp. JUb58]
MQSLAMNPGAGGLCLVAWASTTVDSESAAQALAQAGVQARLAACAQVDKIHSHYWWDGQLQQADEWRITWKTTPQSLPALQRLLLPLHPYTLPQWLWGETAASPAYAAWVAGEVGPALQA